MDPRAKRPRPAGLTETARSARAAKEGPERDRAEDLLLRRANALVSRFVRRYRGPDVADDDLTAEALIAVWQALRTWDPRLMRSFDAWARIIMRGACQKAIIQSRIVRGVHHGRMTGKMPRSMS